MSLIGKRVIPVPAGVEISIDAERNVTVKGPKGTLTMTHRPEVSVAFDAAFCIDRAILAGMWC